MASQRIYGVLVDIDEHYPQLLEAGDADDNRWQPRCICGWNGIPIFQEVDVERFVSSYRELALKHGTEVLLPPNAVFGIANDAEIQILKHLNYDPNEDKKFHQETFSSKQKELFDFSLDDTAESEELLFELTFDVVDLAKELSNQKKRELIWFSTRLPQIRKNASEMDMIRKKFLISQLDAKNVR